MSRVRFHPEARAEFLDSIEYYEAQRPGLGAAFIAEVEKATNLVLEHPNIGSPVGSGFRQIVVHRFPFVVIYRVENDELYVLAVAHTSRRPGYWRRRGRQKK